MVIKKKDKIFIAGHKGLVGSAIIRNLEKNGYKNLVVISKNKLNLVNQNAVFRVIMPQCAKLHEPNKLSYPRSVISF